MKIFYCVICGKYRKLKKPKVSYIFKITSVLSITCKGKNEDEVIFKEEESIEILEILRLI